MLGIDASRMSQFVEHTADLLMETFRQPAIYNVGQPFDFMNRKELAMTTSGIAKQEMLRSLQDDYKMVGTLFDDSPYNIEGARMQGVDAVHLRTNDAYWDAHPETVLRYPDDIR